MRVLSEAVSSRTCNDFELHLLFVIQSSVGGV
jgi:hypothetical protein